MHFSMDWRMSQKLAVDGASEEVGQNKELIKRYCTYDTVLHVSSSRQLREKIP
jgi:hypothetical protein